jgi:hypothetical protein
MITDTVKRVKMYRIALEVEKYVEDLAQRKSKISYTRDFSSHFLGWLKKDLSLNFDADIEVEYKYEADSPTDTFIISVYKTFGIKLEIKKGELYV